MIRTLKFITCLVLGHDTNPPIIEAWASKQGSKKIYYICRRCLKRIGEKYYDGFYKGYLHDGSLSAYPEEKEYLLGLNYWKVTTMLLHSGISMIWKKSSKHSILKM